MKLFAAPVILIVEAHNEDDAFNLIESFFEYALDMSNDDEVIRSVEFSLENIEELQYEH